MRILVFGATGLIGKAVTRAATSRGYDVLAVVRSIQSATAVSEMGASVILGDMKQPETWQTALHACDAVIQVAADFGGDLGASEAVWVNAVIEVATTQKRDLHVIYTGGCWLFPPRIDPPLTEHDDFDPLPPFAYMVDHRARLLQAGLRVSTIHPGMVWSEEDGCTSEIRTSLERCEPIEVVGSTSVQWPLVHVEDLADLYILALSGAIVGGDAFGVSDPGVSVADIIAEMEQRTYRVGVCDIVGVEDAVRRMGDWAAGRARSQRIESDLARRQLGWCPHRFFKVSGRAAHQEPKTHGNPA